VLARFFIDRPIFAWVISIVIILGGAYAYISLPVAQYPEITPPTIQVTCVYPGADARVLQDTVAAPIEQQVNGVEGMMYMSSNCSNDGTYTLNVTFKLGTDIDMAQVLVQNRVQLAQPKLPDVVKATGVSVKKKSPAILLVVNLVCDDDPAFDDRFVPLGSMAVAMTDHVKKKPRYDQLYLSNYATIRLRDELARLDGVGDVNLLGQQDYSMRIWVDPDKLASRDMTADDVVAALKEQNIQVAAGQIGQPPVARGQAFQYTMTAQGRLVDEEQFGSIVLKTGENGQVTYVRDVARVQLGAQNQNVLCTLDGRPSAGVAIYQLPGSNALKTADRVHHKMSELEQKFPEGVHYKIVYDTTPFVEESVDEVLHTLRDAVILVAIVVLVFLQDWKAVILPLIDVGVSLVGTLAVMKVFGFTLNNLTLFGLVLAIGIVVDDAIVVLENIERWLAKGLTVREATIGAMNEITGPIIAITLVLSSVFLPSTLLTGITGEFYRQFALTISASMVISAINAMTLTPARAGSIFKDPKPGEKRHQEHEALPWWGSVILAGLLTWWILGKIIPMPEHPSETVKWSIYAGMFLPGAVVGFFTWKYINKGLSVFFKWFNRGFDKLTHGYSFIVGKMLRLCLIVLVVYVGLIGLTGYMFTQVPTGFVPSQDKGYLVVDIQLDDSASLERTVEVTEQVERIIHEEAAVDHTIAVPGMSFVLSANSSNFGSMFVILKPFDDREGFEGYSEVVAQRIRQRCAKEILNARVSVFGAPAIDGLGNAGGFKLMVEDQGDNGLAALQGQADALAEAGSEKPGVLGVRNSFRANTPQLFIDIDRTKCKSMGVELTSVFNLLQVYLGGYYVNDFNKFGRTWQVNIQAESDFRADAEAVRNLKVRNNKGEMVPIGSVATIRDASGPIMITRYNNYPAATITGVARPGVSSGDVTTQMETAAKDTLPNSMSAEWTELTYLEKQSQKAESLEDLMGNPLTAFVLAVVLVFLVLSAQYESWSLPLSVILVVPMCLLAALAGIAVASMDMNIFVQIGFVVLIGLAAKNAILVVEFAKEQQLAGKSRFEATLEAAHTRLRPIVMTSFAFILGVVPLVLASGAGAEMRRTLGVAVCAGMIGVTFFGIFLTPVFYYVVMWLAGDPTPVRSAGETKLATGGTGFTTKPSG